jgi:hypothetical protein
MSEFFKVLLIIFLILTLLRIFFRYIFPHLLSRFLNRKMQEMTERFNNFQNQGGNKTNDDVIINNSSKHKKYSKNSGEYIDYEEIKD